MKAVWEATTLGKISQIKGGKRVPKGYTLSTTPTEFPYIRVTDFNDYGSIDLSDLRYIDGGVHSQIRNYIINSKDLYISIAGTIGKTGIIPDNLCGANLTENACRLVFNSGIYNRFIYYFTKTADFIEQAGVQTRTAAQPKLALSRLSNIQLAVPPLPEQQRIVTILDKAFEGIATATANAKRNLTNTRELFDSHLQSVLTNKGQGWETKKLGDVCSLLNRGVSPKYLEQDGICVLNQKCIRDHQVSFEQSRRHDQYAKPVNQSRLIQLGDGLVNSTGTGTLGRVAQVRDVPIEPTTVDSHVTIVRPKPDKFFLDFFGYMLIFIEEKIKEAGEGCGGQTELARSVLAEKFIVSYPISLREQQLIVNKLDNLSAETKKLEAIYQQKITALDELKKSILNQAFSGQF